MSQSILFTRAARLDRRRIHAWLRQPGSGRVAHTRLDRLDASIVALAQAPFAHRAGSAPETRLLISQGYRVLYRILADGSGSAMPVRILIVRIYGPGQSFD